MTCDRAAGACVAATKTPILPIAPGTAGGARQHQPGELGTVLRGIPPREERAQAVPDQEDRQPLLLLASVGARPACRSSMTVCQPSRSAKDPRGFDDVLPCPRWSDA